MNYSNSNTTRRATPKQIAFLDRLLAEKDAPLALVRDLEAAREDGLSSRDASRFIDGLLASPRKQIAKRDPGVNVDAIDEGFWRTGNGDVWQVKYNRAKTNLYALRLLIDDADASDVRFEWNFVRGGRSIIARNGPARLTLEEAKHYGSLYGRCLICSRTLTDPVSIEAGIGPICASRF